MPRANWLEELPPPARDHRALERLTRALTDYERSAAFHRGEVG